MKPHISALTLGVKDVQAAKKFYAEGLGWPIEQDYGQWVAFSINGGNAVLGLFSLDALAADAGVPVAQSGSQSITLSYLVNNGDRVAEVIAEAERAGAKVLKPAENTQWGGVGGIFADLEGYIWKVASGSASLATAE